MNPIRYEYGRHTFGAKNSQTCANYALQQCAKDYAQEPPQSTKLIMRNFYMNDFVTSVPSAEQAIEIYKLLRAMLAKGSFQLIKWISNCEQTMTSIDQADKSPCSSKTFKAEPTSPSILGMQWNVDADNLCRCMQRHAEGDTDEDNSASGVIPCFSCVRSSGNSVSFYYQNATATKINMEGERTVVG